MSQSLKLFVNYRRADHSEFVEHMRSWFMYRYGRENVFMDFDTIPPFTRFENFIKTKVRECDAVVTVIGPRWVELLRERTASGKPDYVQIELEEALAHGKVVAPICIQEATVPSDEDIPETLRPIFARNVATLRSGKDILDYIDDIMDALEVELANQGRQRTVENPAAATSVSGEHFNIYEAVDLYYKAVDVQDWPGALILLARMRGAGVTIPDFFNLDQEEKRLQAQIRVEEEARRRREVAEYLYGFVRVMAHHGQDIRAALKEIWAVEPGYDPDKLATKSKTAAKKKSAPSAGWWNKPRILIPGVLIISAGIIGSFILLNGGVKNVPPTPTIQASEQVKIEPVTQTASVTAVSSTQAVIHDPSDQTIEPPTSEPTLTESQNAYALAEAGVTRNADWTPYFKEFDGVKMALVPKGCFQMGSDGSHSDEKPVHQVCFDKPFWIDLTEVTNAQFRQFGGRAGRSSNSAGDNHPRELIKWSDATNFCKMRGGRLPTEAEWEYAARGPESLIYPWGNDFVQDNVVVSGPRSSGTYGSWNVGSRPTGKSWVGVLDLSGNVWEWVNDLYDASYYGTLIEPIIDPQGPGAGQFHALKGGSFDWATADSMRAARRDTDSYAYWGLRLDWGFRCARDY